MRILYLGGGLGNQIFEYAVYMYLKRKYPEDKLYTYYNKKSFSEHNGLEITRFFQVDLPHPPFFAKAVLGFFFILKKLFGCNKWTDTSGPIIQNENAICIAGYRDNKRYIPNNPDWLQFNTPELSQKNKVTLEKINDSDSVFLHVRRGDYLAPKYKKLFEGTCTLEYYNKAIELMKLKHPDATFFVFSNDMEWTKNNIFNLGKRVVYVDWNQGDNSYLDMFLMSHCKAGIMANSTFSFWGAKIGSRKDIIYPAKWSNSPFGNPDIFDEDWISI